MMESFKASDFANLEATLREGIARALQNQQIGSVAGVDPLLEGLLLESIAVQSKALAKFGDGLWWCTDRALQQATVREVAELKANWLPGPVVYDLCCGIGGDTMRLASSTSRPDGELVALDNDEMLLAMAAENLRLNFPPDVLERCSFHSGSVSELPLEPDASVHIDPDRRVNGGRKTRPQDYSPDWTTIEKVIETANATIVKLAPAAELDDHAEHHRIWTSFSRSVREQSLLCKTAIDAASTQLSTSLHPGGRSAVVLGQNGQPSVFSCEADELQPRAPVTDSPAEWIVDPDAAIRSAGLTEAFANRFELQTVGGPAGYLTGTSAAAPELSICERILWCGSPDDRKLRKTLRSLDAFPMRVKTRGVDHNPNVLEKRYRQCGEQPVTLWIGRQGKRRYAVISESDEIRNATASGQSNSTDD
jgi:hypothetical protein